MRVTKPESDRSPRLDAKVTDDPLDPSVLMEGLAGPGDGAVLLFVGQVRNHNEGRAVAGLEYEAYGEMAVAELRRILHEATVRFPVSAISAVHRTGRLEPGEPSVAIAVSAAHRADGYDASRYVIEELKRRLPVWKHERYAEGDSEWLGSTEEATR